MEEKRETKPGEAFKIKKADTLITPDDVRREIDIMFERIMAVLIEYSYKIGYDSNSLKQATLLNKSVFNTFDVSAVRFITHHYHSELSLDKVANSLACTLVDGILINENVILKCETQLFKREAISSCEKIIKPVIYILSKYYKSLNGGE